MGRFVLNKGDRFSLEKTAGLNNIRVVLGWKGSVDLDACAFLLTEDGTIADDADFVFYNSNYRETAYDRNVHINKKRWREMTRPMSADGSVMGSLDDKGDSQDNSGDASEEMTVNLDKVNPKIVEIVFCVAIYDKNITFGSVNNPYITIINDDNGEELCRYDLKESFQSETAVVAGSLLCNVEGEWSFEAVGKGYVDGMQALIDIYA